MTIMIIEDSKPMRNLIKRTLKQAGFGEHEIIEAGDGEEGLALIKASKPDLVLCDWNMPKMNGMELLKALKREAIDVKFGFVTSEQSQEMRDDADAEGALFLIGKPFTAENFNRELTAVFGKDDAAGTSVPLKDWLDAVVLATKQVSSGCSRQTTRSPRRSRHVFSAEDRRARSGMRKKGSWVRCNSSTMARVGGSVRISSPQTSMTVCLESRG